MAPTAQAEISTAIDLCVASLQDLASFELDESLQRRMMGLGERKEFLDVSEHEELMSLVAFTEKRTAEKLRAQLALRRLRESMPGMVKTP